MKLFNTKLELILVGTALTLNACATDDGDTSGGLSGSGGPTSSSGGDGDGDGDSGDGDSGGGDGDSSGGDGDSSGGDAGSGSGDGDGDGDGDTGGAGDGDGDSDGFFVMDPDGGGVGVECDIFAQDCPDGQKCMPWSNDGSYVWNATKCTQVDANPNQPGDPCTVEGNASTGVDDCAAGSMCYNVDPSDNTGTCYAVCGGSLDAPTCDEITDQCGVYNDGVLPLCFPKCDPILADCPDGELCLSNPSEPGFICILDSKPNDDGGYGTVCEFSNACDPGLFCAAPTVVPECAGPFCCSQFCDLEGGGSAQCEGASGGQDCLPWFAEGTAPPEFETVGFCGIPS